MTASDLLAIMLRFLAIVVGLFACHTIFQLFYFLIIAESGFRTDNSLTAPLFWTLFYQVVFILTCWFLPRTMAQKIVPPDLDKTVVLDNKMSWFVMLIILLGIYFFYYASADGAYWFAFYRESSEVMDASNKAGMIATFTEWGISLLLIFRAKSIATLLYRLAK